MRQWWQTYSTVRVHTCEGNAAASHEAAVTEEKAEAKTSATVGDDADPVPVPEQTPETLPTDTSAAEQEKQKKTPPKVASKAKTSAKGKATKSKDAKKKDEVVKPDAAPKQEAVQEEIPGPFEGHFLHPKFPKGKIPMHLKFDTRTQASWTTGKKTFKLTTVEIDGDKFRLSDGLTTAEGAKDAKGNRQLTEMKKSGTKPSEKSKGDSKKSQGKKADKLKSSSKGSESSKVKLAAKAGGKVVKAKQSKAASKKSSKLKAASSKSKKKKKKKAEEEEEEELEDTTSGTLFNPVIGSVIVLMSAPAGLLLVAFGAFLWVKSQEDTDMGAEEQ